MKEHLVLSKDTVDYRITVDQNPDQKTYCLIRSESEQWTEHCRGEIALTIVSDGEGYRFVPKLKKHLDYAQTMELMLLLQFIHREDPMYEGRVVAGETQYEI